MKKIWTETILYGALSMLFGLAFFFSLLYEDNSLVMSRCYRINPAYAQETTYTVEMLEQMDLDTLHTVLPEEKIRYGFYFCGKKPSDRRR